MVLKSNYETWENIHSKKEWGKYPNEELVRFIGSNFFKLSRKERKKIKILEMGFGQGANIWFLIREGFDVYGIDISNSAKEKLKARLENEKILPEEFDNHFKVQDIRKVSFSENYFDVVIDVAAILCVSYTDHNIVYNKINNMLKKDGLFFSWHLLKDSWGDDGENYIDKDTKEEVDVGPLAKEGILYFAKLDDLISLFEKNKFSVLNTEKLERTYENMQYSLKYAINVLKKN